LPVFRFNKVFDVARDVRMFLNPQGGVTEDAAPHSERDGDPKNGRLGIPEQRKRLESKRRELRRVRKEAQAAKYEAEFIEQRKRKKRVQQEIFELERELRAAKEGTKGEGPATGALPDFVIIGGQKCGTTSLYHLLSQHPHVEPAAKKELHFFDLLFDEGVEWYERCFPRPKWIDERRTITGEATPYYLFHPHAAKRMAKVIPQAQLIALLRNPVERAYSHYQMVARKGKEPRTFEEAVGAEEARLRSERNKLFEDEHYASLDHQHFSYLSRGIYVDQLLRWSEFFDKEQMLILKSEDFFDRPRNTLKTVFDFLDLPDWEPEAWEVRKKGNYEQDMNSATRRRLNEYFEPHNRRLYDYLGVDFGW
jgi:hypothetical protein